MCKFIRITSARLALRELILKTKLNTNQKDNGCIEALVRLLLLAWRLIDSLKADQLITVLGPATWQIRWNLTALVSQISWGIKIGQLHLARLWKLDGFLDPFFSLGEWRLGSDQWSAICGTQDRVFSARQIWIYLFPQVCAIRANIPCPNWDSHQGHTFLICWVFSLNHKCVITFLKIVLRKGTPYFFRLGFFWL